MEKVSFKKKTSSPLLIIIINPPPHRNTQIEMKVDRQKKPLLKPALEPSAIAKKKCAKNSPRKKEKERSEEATQLESFQLLINLDKDNREEAEDFPSQWDTIGNGDTVDDFKPTMEGFLESPNPKAYAEVLAAWKESVDCCGLSDDFVGGEPTPVFLSLMNIETIPTVATEAELERASSDPITTSVHLNKKGFASAADFVMALRNLLSVNIEEATSDLLAEWKQEEEEEEEPEEEEQEEEEEEQEDE